MLTDRTCPLPHPDGAPAIADDRAVCPRCAGTLRGLLTDLPGLLADIDIARTRQARIGTPGAGGRSSTVPLMFALAPADARFVLLDTVLAWLDWITAVRGDTPPRTWAGVGAYLRDAVDWLAQHPDGAWAIDELTAAVRNARAAIDRPADRAYAGPCTAQVDTLDDPDAVELLRDCGADLYAPPGAAVVICRACGTQYDAPARRAWLLEQARDVLLPARDIARAVDGLGVDISLDTVKSWVRRDRLVAHGHVVIRDGRTAATYRVGDVLDLVQAAAERRRAVPA